MVEGRARTVCKARPQPPVSHRDGQLPRRRSRSPRGDLDRYLRVGRHNAGARVSHTARKRLRTAFVVLLAMTPLPLWAAANAAALNRQALKIYVSVDMEGVAGVVSADQLNPPGFEYERFRGFMTDVALAGVHGAVDAGATEVVVSDS